MREIKFKIWADNRFYHKCIVGNTNNTDDDKWTCPLVWLEDKKEWVHCDNGIICQYTELKDKNGVEIYEGDIVKFKYKNKKIIAEIKYGTFLESKCDEYDCCHYGYYLDYKWSDYCENTGMDLFDVHTMCEIIGNIYENPELLEAGD